MYRNLPKEVARAVSRRLALIYEACLLSGICTAWKLSYKSISFKLRHKYCRTDRSTTPITSSVSVKIFCFVSKTCSEAHRLMSLSFRPRTVLRGRSLKTNKNKNIGAEYLINRAPGFLSSQAKRLGGRPFSSVNLHSRHILFMV